MTTVQTSSNNQRQKSALTLLKADHDKVKALFKQYEKLAEKQDVAGKTLIANEICAELTVHAAAEEDVFYSAAKEKIDDDDLINEADVEHDTAKDLIAQLQTMSHSDPMYDAKMKVLDEYISHHVEEEESEMFPKARAADLDLKALGAEFTAKKDALMEQVQDRKGNIDPQKLKTLAVEEASHKH